jgi:hypothetical protein
MMFTGLNASDYEHNGVFYNAEFVSILSKIIACYNLMIIDKISLINDENSIRDILLINYLRNNNVRKKVELTDYLFDREVPEDRSIGRTDIKIQTLNTFIDTSAYYTIECKRLDATNPTGRTGLNAKYIENGIYRFAAKKYSTYYNTNGMIGFVVESIDIHKNVTYLNTLLKTSFSNANAIRILRKYSIVEGFDYSYYSTHRIDTEEIIIYHLMFDFAKVIH